MTIVRRNPVLLVGVLIGLAMGGAEVAGGHSAWQAVIAAAFPIGYATLVAIVARRSETVSVLAGRPVDERWEHINLEATAWALGLSAIVVLAAFIVADAIGGDRTPYAFMGAVMAIAYLGSLLLVRLRH